jgi:hypothetical protein
VALQCAWPRCPEESVPPAFYCDDHKNCIRSRYTRDLAEQAIRGLPITNLLILDSIEHVIVQAMTKMRERCANVATKVIENEDASSDDFLKIPGKILALSLEDDK